MTEKTLGNVIREKRAGIDLSLRDLAKRVQVSAAFLSDVELGRRYPSDEVLTRLAKVLEVSTEDLKQFDHRESLANVKKMLDLNPTLSFALRTAVDDIKEGKVTADDVAQRLKTISRRKR